MKIKHATVNTILLCVAINTQNASQQCLHRKDFLAPKDFSTDRIKYVIRSWVQDKKIPRKIPLGHSVLLNAHFLCMTHFYHYITFMFDMGLCLFFLHQC